MMKTHYSHTQSNLGLNPRQQLKLRRLIKIIVKLTLVEPPLPPLADCCICPDWFGTNNSAPCSPTMYGCPFDTAPPDAFLPIPNAPLKELPIALNILPPPLTELKAACFLFSFVNCPIVFS